MTRHSQARVRLVDIAARAEVSAAVVSTVLRGGSNGNVRVSPPTADRVRRIAQEMHYQPNLAARQLRSRRSDVIGVLIGAETSAANHERLWAIEEEAHRRGYRLMIGQFRDEADRTAQYIHDFVGRGVDGLICFHNPLPKQDPQVLRMLRRARHVVFQTEPLLEHACCVDVDRAAGVRHAVEHLLARGRHRIALVLNDIHDRLMQDRLEGYLTALGHHKLPVDRSLIWAGSGTFPPTAQLLESAVATVIQQARADAIIASNDIWAIELIKLIRRHGKQVPQDVAIIGFDNLPAAELFDPGLTSIDQNNDEFAKAAVGLLLRSIETGNVPVSQRKVIVPARLIVREST